MITCKAVLRTSCGYQERAAALFRKHDVAREGVLGPCKVAALIREATPGMSSKELQIGMALLATIDRGQTPQMSFQDLVNTFRTAALLPGEDPQRAEQGTGHLLDCSDWRAPPEPDTAAGATNSRLDTSSEVGHLNINQEPSHSLRHGTTIPCEMHCAPVSRH